MGAAFTDRPAAELLARLAEPFDPAEVRFKPGRVSGSRALALAYVDARARACKRPTGGLSGLGARHVPCRTAP
jgi:hypothetical protein